MTNQTTTQDSNALKVSVIVTNYNYGHYLEACLESLRAQNCAPDEIIVVNDGSTDGSAKVLSGLDDVVVIDQPNGGQAAAFNTGFLASSGEIVIFVDADDKLHHHAVEVIRRLWTDNISALSFCLNVIDRRGRGIGQYAMDLPDGDLLPRLLNQLTIPFMPTSGNAFRRAAIEWAFPLPTARWRISADALLIRAAVLSAPIRQIRQVLGAYRVHGQNNYFRAGSTGMWKTNRGLRDIAQAGLDLIEIADRGGRELTRAERAKLLMASVRCQLKAEILKFDPKALGLFQRSVLRLSRGTRLTLSLALYLYAAKYSRRVRGWAVDPRFCPRVLMAVPDIIRGRELTRDLAEIVAVRSPFDTSLSPDGAGPKDPLEWLTGPEWVRDHSTGGADLCGISGWLELRRAWTGSAALNVDLAPSSGSPVSVSVFHNGLPVGSHDLTAREIVQFKLPGKNAGLLTLDSFEFRSSDLVPGRFGPLSRMWRRSVRFQVRGISLVREIAEPAAGVLQMASPVSMALLGDVVQTANGRVLSGKRLIGSGETLSLALPPLKPPYCLSLRLSREQVPGHLSVTMDGRALCSADLMPGGSCLIEMPSHLSVFDSPAVLQFGFQPNDFLDDLTVTIDALSWMPQAVEGRYGLPTLTPGGWVGPGSGRPLADFLGAGWSQTSDGTAVMHGGTAQLILSQAAVSRDTVLCLDLEPLDLQAVQENLVLVICVNGEMCAEVQLAGPARIDVNMAGFLSGPRHKVEVDLYAATRPAASDQAGDHGGIQLNGLGLAPQKNTGALSPQKVLPEADMQVTRRLSDLGVALRQGASEVDLAALREDLASGIAALSASAARGNLSADDFARMAALSAKLPMQSGSTEVPPAAPNNWERDLALQMLRGPAFVTLRGIALRDLPEMTPDFAEVLGAYLVADPIAGAERTELRLYQDYLVEMMDQVRVALASFPDDSPLGALAGAMVTAFRPRQLLFSDLPLRPHVQAFGRALEAKLLRAGHDLFAPQIHAKEARRGKPRIGVILHNTVPSPETWIWRSLLRKLPRDAAEITLFLTEQNDAPTSGFEGCNTVGLAGHSLASAVLAIRAAQMDVLLLGANFYGHCFMTELCAHRLAPRQMALSAVFPATTGLSSVDTFVLGKSVAPRRVESDYSETVIWAPGTGQTFDIPQAPELAPEMRKVTRRRLGVSENAVMLVSGAMQNKIGADVLSVWVQALADVPDAVLVLYPFATSWQQCYDAPTFRARLTAVCKAHSVDLARVRVLPPIPNREVKQVLAAADVYLDSFPYSGATTTVEALECGVPVVALQGRTQRGQQAAGWLLEFELRDLVAKSKPAYIKILTDLANSEARRAQMRGRIAAARDKAMGQRGFAKWLEACLLPQLTQLDKPRYLFHHMPKTGGTSLKAVFATWFDLVEDYRPPWAYIMPPKLDLQSIGPKKMLCGHFAADTAPLTERYPETGDPKRWRKISFVRDPLERAISIHAYEKKLRLEYDQTYEPIPLGEYLRTNQGIFLSHFECDESNWRAALDSYWFIGTLERLPESLDSLAAKLGKPAPEFLPHDNITSREEDVSEEDIAIFRTNNAVEYEIYAEVAARLGGLLSQHSGD